MRIITIKTSLLALLLFFAFSNCGTQGKETNEKISNVFTEDWSSLENVNPTPDWFLDAKFGIYTHWGPHSGAFVNMAPNQKLRGWHGMQMYGKNGNKQWQTGKVRLGKDGKPDNRPSVNYLHHI